MTMRVVTPANGASVLTVASPDAYGTPMTLQAGTVMDVAPGGPWEAAIGTSNLSPLSGAIWPTTSRATAARPPRTYRRAGRGGQPPAVRCGIRLHRPAGHGGHAPWLATPAPGTGWVRRCPAGGGPGRGTVAGHGAQEPGAGARLEHAQSALFGAEHGWSAAGVRAWPG